MADDTRHNKNIKKGELLHAKVDIVNLPLNWLWHLCPSEWKHRRCSIATVRCVRASARSRQDWEGSDDWRHKSLVTFTHVQRVRRKGICLWMTCRTLTIIIMSTNCNWMWSRNQSDAPSPPVKLHMLIRWDTRPCSFHALLTHWMMYTQTTIKCHNKYVKRGVIRCSRLLVDCWLL